MNNIEFPTELAIKIIKQEVGVYCRYKTNYSQFLNDVFQESFLFVYEKFKYYREEDSCLTTFIRVMSRYGIKKYFVRKNPHRHVRIHDKAYSVMKKEDTLPKEFSRDYYVNSSKSLSKDDMCQDLKNEIDSILTFNNDYESVDNIEDIARCLKVAELSDLQRELIMDVLNNPLIELSNIAEKRCKTRQNIDIMFNRSISIIAKASKSLGIRENDYKKVKSNRAKTSEKTISMAINLIQSGSSVSKAAETIGISVQTLSRYVSPDGSRKNPKVNKNSSDKVA